MITQTLSSKGEATSEPKFSQENIMMNGLYAVAEIRKVQQHFGLFENEVAFSDL